MRWPRRAGQVLVAILVLACGRETVQDHESPQVCVADHVTFEGGASVFIADMSRCGPRQPKYCQEEEVLGCCWVVELVDNGCRCEGPSRRPLPGEYAVVLRDIARRDGRCDAGSLGCSELSICEVLLDDQNAACPPSTLARSDPGLLARSDPPGVMLV